MSDVQKLREAEGKFAIAMNHFNNVDSEFFEQANQEVTIALSDLNAVRSKLNMKLVEL